MGDTSHNICERWVNEFQRRIFEYQYDEREDPTLLKGNKMEILVFETGDEEHTVLAFTFKDGSVFYFDLGTLSGGGSHIGLPEDIPSHWKPKPKQNEQ